MEPVSLLDCRRRQRLNFRHAERLAADDSFEAGALREQRNPALIAKVGRIQRSISNPHPSYVERTMLRVARAKLLSGFSRPRGLGKSNRPSA